MALLDRAGHKAMATARMKSKRRVSLRKITAKHFLSNISLDGTYTDTKYLFCDWKHHKIKKEKVECNKEIEKQPTSERIESQSSISAPYQSGSAIESDNVSSKTCQSPSRPRAHSMLIGKPPYNAEADKDKSEKALPKRWR